MYCSQDSNLPAGILCIYDYDTVEDRVQVRICLCVVCRAQTAFETSIKKGSRGCDYLVPIECLVQLNVLYDLRRRLDQLCLITSDPLAAAASERTLAYSATLTVFTLH